MTIGGEGMTAFGIGVLIIYFGTWAICIAAYFLPSFIAFGNHHPKRWPIFWLNLFLGLTAIGWIAALVWACTPAASAEDEPAREQYPSERARAPLKVLEDPVAQIERLKCLHDNGTIDAQEYGRLRQPYVDALTRR